MSNPVGPIRPFISSTFRDFQEERGHLNSIIFPQLNSLCYSIGTYFAPVELRWGVTKAQSESGQVVSLCLDNIQRCEPYFICLLGDRYGSHRPSTRRPTLQTSHGDLPDDSLRWLDESFLNAAESGHDWVLGAAYQNLSVTELEIQEAVFRKRFQHCRFYFREERLKKLEVKFEQNERRLDSLSLCIPTTTTQGQEVETQDEEESEECKLRLSNLKQKILDHGLPVKYFCTAEELGRHILDDWRDIINTLQPQLQRLPSGAGSEFYHEKVAHETYAETRRRVFIETKSIKELHKKLDQHAMSATGNQIKSKNSGSLPSIFTIVGESGCGKSAILANWVSSFHKQHPDFGIISHFVGSSASSTDVTSFLRRAIYELGGEHAGNSTEDNTDMDSISTFRILCSEFETAIVNYQAPCVLVVDGIDELGPTSGLGMEQVRNCPWIPDPIPEHCKFIISTNVSDKCLRDHKDEIIESATNCISDREDTTNVMKGLLSVHCKKLDRIQLDKVVGAKLSYLPLYLAIVANELRVVATFDNLDDYLNEYVSETTFEGLWTRVIKRWICDYGRTNGATTDAIELLVGVNWVSDMLRLIACSRKGLTETEIRGILNRKKWTYTTLVNGLDFARLRSATFDALFERRGGLFNFSHHDLRKAVHTHLLVQQGLKKSSHEKIAGYFRDTKPSLRRTEELAFQYEELGDMQKLLNEMTDPQLFLICGSENQRFDPLRLNLVRLWHCLVKSGEFGDERIAAAYVDMVNVAASTDGRRAEETQNPVNYWRQPNARSLRPLESEDVQQASKDQKKDMERKVKLKEVVTAMMAAKTFLQVANIGPTGSRLCGTDQDGNQSELVVEELLIATYISPGGTRLSVSEAAYQIQTEPLVTATHTATDKSTERAASSESFLDSTENRQQDEHNLKLARLQMETGKLLMEKTCLKQAEELFTNAVDVMKRVSIMTSGLSLLVQIQESLAEMYYVQLEDASAFQYYEEALSTLQKIGFDTKDSNYQKLMETKGRLLNRLGLLFGRSRPKYESVIKGLQKLKEANECMNEANSRAGKVTTMYNIGRLRIKAKDFKIGERYLREALRERERWNGRSHPLVAEVLHQLAFCLKKELERSEVKAFFERALAIRKKIFGTNHHLVATSLFHLGLLLRENGTKEEAVESEKLMKEALHIRESKFGKEHMLTNNVHAVLNKSSGANQGPTGVNKPKGAKSVCGRQATPKSTPTNIPFLKEKDGSDTQETKLGPQHRVTQNERSAPIESPDAKQSPSGVQKPKGPKNVSGRQTARKSTRENNPKTNLFTALKDQCEEMNQSPVYHRNSGASNNNNNKSKPKKQNETKTHDLDLPRSTKTTTYPHSLFFNHLKSISIIFLIICVSIIIMYFAY